MSSVQPHLFKVTKGRSTVSVSNFMFLILSFCKVWRAVIASKCSSFQTQRPENVILVRWLIMSGEGSIASPYAPCPASHLTHIDWRSWDIFKFPGTSFSLASYTAPSPKSKSACLNFGASGTCRRKTLNLNMPNINLRSRLCMCSAWISDCLISDSETRLQAVVLWAYCKQYTCSSATSTALYDLHQPRILINELKPVAYLQRGQIPRWSNLSSLKSWLMSWHPVQ